MTSAVERTSISSNDSGSVIVTRNLHELTPVPFNDNARRVFDSRIAKKAADGKTPVETPEQAFWRVASAVASAEQEPKRDFYAEKFYDMLASLKFLPNSPTLVNAGNSLGQLSACFVLPVPDSIEGIFEAVKQTAIIHKSGGGTGFSFSQLRSKGSVVEDSAGVASGPIGFMRIFDAATGEMKQGGVRRGANMGILRVDHPDILEFIDMKHDMTTLQNFNISVAVTEDFMVALTAHGEYDLVDPHTGQVTNSLKADHVWDRIIENAWYNGDPGVVFIDRINGSKANPVPSRGPIEATNPCGEQPLYANDSCNLGSIDVSKFYSPIHMSGVHWEELLGTVELAVRFLDNVISVNKYPTPEIAITSHAIRRIGLGVMGVGDLFFRLGIPYGSEMSRDLARTMMERIQRAADEASKNLAAERGAYPECNPDRPIRNSTRTTIAPTGTLSILAGCSGGIEPVFALAFERAHYIDRDNADEQVKMLEINSHFQATAERHAWGSPDLYQFLARGGHLADRPEVPDWAKETFVTSHDVTPLEHVAMQAAFQEFTDNAVSKTINFPNEATKEDVRNAYMAAWQWGCLGITVYRDGSRDAQVLGFVKEAPALEAVEVSEVLPNNWRVRMPNCRQSETHKFRVGDFKAYLTIGLYDNGQPGEIFINGSKAGSTIDGLLDAFCTSISYNLQHGVPLIALVNKFRGSKFEPSGLVRSHAAGIHTAGSIVDYVFRYLEWRFATSVAVDEMAKWEVVGGGEECPQCSSALMTYSGGCPTCLNCGWSKC